METTTDNAVLEKTRELCQTILADADYRSTQRDVEAFMNNDEAKAAYEKLADVGESLHEKQHQGVALTQQEVASYEALRTAFMANPVARNFLDAQEKMHDLEKTVKRYVKKTIELGRLPTEEEVEEGCGSGCGCGHGH